MDLEFEAPQGTITLKEFKKRTEVEFQSLFYNDVIKTMNDLFPMYHKISDSGRVTNEKPFDAIVMLQNDARMLAIEYKVRESGIKRKTYTLSLLEDSQKKALEKLDNNHIPHLIIVNEFFMYTQNGKTHGDDYITFFTYQMLKAGSSGIRVARKPKKDACYFIINVIEQVTTPLGGSVILYEPNR